jgi:hypothetical protein
MCAWFLHLTNVACVRGAPRALFSPMLSVCALRGAGGDSFDLNAVLQVAGRCVSILATLTLNTLWMCSQRRERV